MGEQLSKAFLVLDDGTIFEGESWACEGETFGEAVFSTGMTGYQETLTDPSYHKQVVVMTAPHIGNTGMNTTDEESKKIWVMDNMDPHLKLNVLTLVKQIQHLIRLLLHLQKVVN